LLYKLSGNFSSDGKIKNAVRYNPGKRRIWNGKNKIKKSESSSRSTLME
jgi:hypothetical protein